MNTQKQISVIIVTYRSEKDIFDCIGSIEHYNDIGEALEIIVVDNCSENFALTKEKLMQQYPEIIIVQNPNNGGYGQGNNWGIRKALAPIVMIMNPDVRLLMPVFKEAVCAFNQHPEMSIYAMQQNETPTHEGDSFGPMPNLPGWLRVIAPMISKRLHLHYLPWLYVSGACFFINKTHFEQIGLFDEDNFMYGEEADIRYRLEQIGCGKTVYNPHLQYLHPIHNRPYSQKTELAMLKAEILLWTKKGWNREKIIRTNIQVVKTQLFLTRIASVFGLRKAEDVHNLQMKLLDFQNELA